MLKRISFAAVICVLVFVGSAHAGKGKAKLSVKSVSSPPATAKAGDTFAVTGKVVNKGKKKGKGRVKVSLRDPKSGVAAKLFSQKLTVKAKSKKTFSGTATVPESAGGSAAGSLPAGSYFLDACVRRSGREKCRAAADRVTIEAQTTTPPEQPPTPPSFTPGSRSAGDSLFPQIGNGGYDAQNYDIELSYDPATNVFEAGTSTTMTALATQNLSEFSLDFQQLPVSQVLVDGSPASFTQEEAEPELVSSIGVPNPTQPSKLTVIPSAGIADGTTFTVEVSYAGTPEVWTDVDGALEGWIPACYTPAAVELCDGNYVVGEPLGSQAWFPSNNVPDDKASFDTSITVPATQHAVGVGELAGDAPVDNGDGTRTWNWSEDDEVSTYLVTASNGTAAFTQDSVALAAGDLPIYNFVDSTNPATVPTTEANLDRGLEQLPFLELSYGPYPFDSSGAWADRTTGIGYALEVATKSHYPGNNAGASVNVNTELHELAHQWFGNTVTNEDWADLWFNEGWAEWSTWFWQFEEDGSSVSPAQQFEDNYSSGPPEKWETPPATLRGDPALMFVPDFPTYVRGAMTLEGYRQIIGANEFLDFAKGLQSEFAYDNITTQEFIAYALDFSGFTGSDLALLDVYFQQWLYGTVRPTILPDDFT